MKIGGRQSVSQITRYNEFGGAPRPYFTHNNLNIMPDVGVYRVDGTGRDTYISMDNGNNFKMYEADKQALRGTIGFGEPRRGESFHKTHAPIEGKRVGYHPNGTGRDNYIS